MVKYRQGQTSVDRYVEGKTQEYSGEQAWVDDRRTISNRARQRDNTGILAIIRERCKGLIQETQARIKTLENTQGKARQGKARQDYDN